MRANLQGPFVVLLIELLALIAASKQLIVLGSDPSMSLLSSFEQMYHFSPSLPLYTSSEFALDVTAGLLSWCGEAFLCFRC